MTKVTDINMLICYYIFSMIQTTERIQIMKSTLLQKISVNRHPMRWVVLAAGTMLGVLAVWHRDGLTGLLAVFLLLQGVTGNGCLVSQTCVPAANKQPDKTGLRQI